MGIRCIEIDVHDGIMQDGQLIPFVAHATSFVSVSNKIRLDTVLEVIEKHAFASSEFPVILSLEIKCDKENQRAMSVLFKNILGDKLLTEKVSHTELELPSPEKLKGKIILKARVDKVAREEEEEEDDMSGDLYIGKVWFRLEGLDSQEYKEKECVWKKDCLSFGVPRNQEIINMCEKPYFVGFIDKTSIEKILAFSPNATKGNFIIRANESNTSFVLTVLTVHKGKMSPLHVKLEYANKKFFIDTNLESNQKFDTMEELVKNFTKQKIGNHTTLGEPMNLKDSNIHKYCDWFVGQIDPATCKLVMESVNKKGLFMVREEQTEYKTNFYIEYHDGIQNQTLPVEQDHEGKIKLQKPGFHQDGYEYETITQVVNHFKEHSHLANATKLVEAIQLRCELLEDYVYDDQNIFKRGEQLSFKRYSAEKGVRHIVDKKERRLRIESIKVTKEIQRIQYKDAQAMNKEESFAMYNATVKLDQINSKSVLLKDIVEGHNKTLVIEADGKTFKVTYNRDIETLQTAILNRCGKLRRMSTRHKSEKVQGTPIKVKKASSFNQQQSHAPLATQNSLSTDITDLVVYCKAKPGGVNMTKIEESLRYIRLQKSKDNDLKEMFGTPVNSLDYDDITSMNNEKLAQVLNEADYKMELIQEFHKTVLTRVYPPAVNIQSGNYNPIPHWQSGAQLVSLNVQTPGLPLQINNAMFATNGNCGYVLKNPEETNEDNSSCLVTLKVLTARHIMTLKPAKEPFLKPNIQVTIQDPETPEETVVLCTAREIDNRKVHKPTGFHTIWDASGSEATAVHNKHMAFMKFTLTEVNNLVYF